MKRNRVFISYSHQDIDFLNRLKVHLRPLERKELVDVWSDSKIRAGDDWRYEIKKALDSASAAILLISADFLASEFIASNELPQLLGAAETRGTRIIPVILKPCSFARTRELAKFQAINDPAKSLLKLTDAEREEVWDIVAATVMDTQTNIEENKSDPYENFDLKDTLGLSDRHFTEASPKQHRENPDLWDPFGQWDGNLMGFFKSELNNLNIVEQYFTYEYQHIDVQGTMPSALEIVGEHPRGKELIEAVKAKLINVGWEGDGDLELIWLPPFIDVGIEDTWGIYIWHVKQSNNGTSWLASPVPLNFKRLAYQN